MWTKQAVETLRKLALEGRSASWIAAALGVPSRNAVIGKASRIGIKLNGGAHSGPRPEMPPATGIPWRRTRSERPPPIEIPWRRASSCARTRAPAVSREERQFKAWTFAATEVGEMRRIGFAEISGVECRWPIGDPTQEDFAYCGLQIAQGRAYCAGHCRMAYRSPNAQDVERDGWKGTKGHGD